MPDLDFYEIRGIIENFEADIARLNKSVEKVIEVDAFITKKIKDIKKELRSLEKDYVGAGNNIVKVEREANYREEGRPAHAVKNEGEREMNQNLYIQASDILMKTIEAAVQVNEEYNHPFFLNRLRQVAYNPDTIRITKYEYGRTVVEIRMNEVAGSLEDYAQGVKKAREHFGVREPHGKTSWFWEEKYYGQAREARPLPQIRNKPRKSLQDKREALINKYWETMQFRMDSVGKIAPFWELLDQGSIPMSSDRGGRPYPEGRKTDFIANAIWLIEDWIYGRKGRNVEYRYDENVPEREIIQENITNTENELKRYENEQEKLSKLLEDIQLVEIDTEIYDDISKRIDDNVDRVDKNKLNSLEIALRTGNFANIRVTKEGRVELTRPGGKRYRVSIRRALRILGGYEF